MGYFLAESVEAVYRVCDSGPWGVEGAGWRFGFPVAEQQGYFLGHS